MRRPAEIVCGLAVCYMREVDSENGRRLEDIA